MWAHRELLCKHPVTGFLFSAMSDCLICSGSSIQVHSFLTSSEGSTRSHGGVTCPIALLCAYTIAKGEEPEVTTFVDHFQGTIDHIFLANDANADVIELLLVPSLVELQSQSFCLPNFSCPSDHLPIGIHLAPFERFSN